MPPAMACTAGSIRPARAALVVCLLLATVLASPNAAFASPGGRRSLDVLVPEAGNLEILAFWVALGGGYFAREGLDVHAVAPDAPEHLMRSFAGGAAQAAVLPGPTYERLIADGFPFVLVANLLQNEPLVLVMRREVANRVKLHSGQSVQRRLDALRSVPLGVSMQDRARLYQLFRAEGLDANIAQIEVRKGEELLAGFAAGQLDAVFVGTPYAERALVEMDGVVLVDTPGGDVPKFTERMIQALALTRVFADGHPDDVRALVRGMARAERAIHAEPAEAVKAITGALPKLDPRRVARAVSLYSRAVPMTPHVEAELIKREAVFYPAGGEPLDSAVNLDSYVITEAAGGAKSAPPSAESAPRSSFLLLAAFALALGIGLLFVFLDQREGGGEGGAGDERERVSRGAAG